MHSSGMRTVRLLTVSQHALGGWGVSASGLGVSARRVSAPLHAGIHPRDQVYPSMQRDRQTPCGQTDTCENITFANFV